MYTLITGASSGIGYELAKIHAQQGKNLILVARSAGPLKALQETLTAAYKIEVIHIIMDLSTRDAAQNLYQSIRDKGLDVDTLINNAGFGNLGHFAETDWGTEEQMIQLNMTTLTQLTKLFLKQMLENGHGRIMNVASTAAFQPGPNMAVYFASKAYVLHLSEAIAQEIKHSKVTITALCPGATESGFQQAANAEKMSMFHLIKMPSSKEVAEYGYKAMMQGKVIAIHGVANRILTLMLRFTPRSIIRAVTQRLTASR